ASMPMETGEYRASTSHLTLEQHGAYTLLRIYYWNNGGLPNDDLQLAAIVRLTPRRWLRIKPTLAAFWGPHWSSHEYLDQQRARALRSQEQKRAAGSKGGTMASVGRSMRQGVSISDAPRRRPSA